MDSLCTAAARALAAGDPLGALQRVALREDADALALRGIAMAQLGELGRSKQLLSRAARAFGAREAVPRARCQVAHAEVALAARDPVSPVADRSLQNALRVLESRGDRLNALHARLVLVRRWLLLGRIDRAEDALAKLDLLNAPAMLVAIAELTCADVELRHVRVANARHALERAAVAARAAGIPALLAEIEQAAVALEAPVARRGQELLRVEQVEAWFASDALVIDACRRSVRSTGRTVSMSKRPILFALVRVLGEAWPQDATRESLIENAFGARRINESHRARLRVELGRVRRELAQLADVNATERGFQLNPRQGNDVVVIAPPIDGDAGALLALLSDGQSWSTSALALALGQSQRTVQRALSELETRGSVRSFGKARARRWLAPPASGFATTLLLPASAPGG